MDELTKEIEYLASLIQFHKDEQKKHKKFEERYRNKILKLIDSKLDEPQIDYVTYTVEDTANVEGSLEAFLAERVGPMNRVVDIQITDDGFVKVKYQRLEKYQSQSVETETFVVDKTVFTVGEEIDLDQLKSFDAELYAKVTSKKIVEVLDEKALGEVLEGDTTKISVIQKVIKPGSPRIRLNIKEKTDEDSDSGSSEGRED